MSTEEIDFFEQSVETGGEDAESIHSGGGNYISAEGMFHVAVEIVEINNAEAGKSLPFVKVLMRAYAGTAESEVGKAINTRLYLASWVNKENRDEGMGPMPETMGKSLLAFLHSFGVISDEAFESDQVKLTRGMFERLENTQAIIKVTKGDDRTVTDKSTGEEKTYAGRYEMKWSNDCWPVNHDKVKDVPKDPELLAAAGVSASTPTDDDLDDI